MCDRKGRPLLRGRPGVRAFLDRHGDEVPPGNLVALYVTTELEFVTAEVVTVSATGDFHPHIIIDRGHQLGAAALILLERQEGTEAVFNTRSITRTSTFRALSVELNMPLLDHLVLAGGEVAGLGRL